VGEQGVYVTLTRTDLFNSRKGCRQRAFCETDLPIQQLVPQTLLEANTTEANLSRFTLVSLKPPLEFPVNAFELAAIMSLSSMQMLESG
jgi:hypothetical protein